MTGMEGCGCLAPGMDVAVVAAVVMEVLDMTVVYNGYEEDDAKDSAAGNNCWRKVLSHNQHRARKKVLKLRKSYCMTKY
jgi:hypothetical protein